MTHLISFISFFALILFAIPATAEHRVNLKSLRGEDFCVHDKAHDDDVVTLAGVPLGCYDRDDDDPETTQENDSVYAAGGSLLMKNIKHDATYKSIIESIINGITGAFKQVTNALKKVVSLQGLKALLNTLKPKGAMCIERFSQMTNALIKCEDPKTADQLEACIDFSCRVVSSSIVIDTNIGKADLCNNKVLRPLVIAKILGTTALGALKNTILALFKAMTSDKGCW